jgi:hypothetical protein
MVDHCGEGNWTGEWKEKGRMLSSFDKTLFDAIIETIATRPFVLCG